MPDNPRKPLLKPNERLRKASRDAINVKTRTRPVAGRCCMLDEILAGLSWFGG